MEHIAYSNILHHLQRHNILCEEQHGFRIGRSCKIRLLNTINDLAKNLDDRKQTDVIILVLVRHSTKSTVTIVFVLNFHIMVFVVVPYFGLKTFLLRNHNKSLYMAVVAILLKRCLVFLREKFSHHCCSFVTLMTYLKMFPLKLYCMQMMYCYTIQLNKLIF